MRDSSLQRASSLGAASGAGEAVPHDGREPSERSDSGWENVRRAFFPFPLWRPPALRRRRSSALAREGGEEEDEDLAEFSEGPCSAAGSPGGPHGTARERGASINAAAFSSIFQGMRRVASRSEKASEQEALAAQRERAVSPASRWVARAQELGSNAASQCSSAIALRVGDTSHGRASTIWASRKHGPGH